MKIAVAIDNCYGYTSDMNTLNRVAELLRAKGHTVTTYGRGPNRIQHAMQYEGTADVMIQIVCGKCIGTLTDFYMGTGRYYRASKGAFMYYKCWSSTWKAVRAHDDNFSRESDIRPYLGLTLPVIFEKMKDKCSYGYGDNADELVNTWLNNFNGTGNNNTTTGTNTSSTNTQNQPNKRKWKDLIIECVQDLDDQGVEILQDGNLLTVRKTRINQYLDLDEKRIFADSVVIQEYDPRTPNVFIDPKGKKYRDEYLIQKYGENELKVNNLEKLTIALAQRDSGHSIDMRIIAGPNYLPGRWVKLNLPTFNIKDRMYYITKCSYVENGYYNITLEPGPPHRKLETTAINTTNSTSNTQKTSVATGRICSAIEKAGGVPITDYKSLYENWKKFVYKFYSEDCKTLDQEISYIQNGRGLNCVDHAQLYYNAYKEAKFPNEIQIVRGVTHCTSGSYGHVWCRVKDNGNWVTVDPSAAAAHKYNLGRLICASGYVTNVNPYFAVHDTGGG